MAHIVCRATYITAVRYTIFRLLLHSDLWPSVTHMACTRVIRAESLSLTKRLCLQISDMTLMPTASTTVAVSPHSTTTMTHSTVPSILTAETQAILEAITLL